MELSERILEDDYPVYMGYAYTVDGKPVISDIQGNVKQLKVYLNATEIKNCDLARRNLL